MLTVYDQKGTTLVARAGLCEVGEATVWIDLLQPSPEEDDWVEKQLGISIPTRAETREIEASSRIYDENGAHYMTAFIVYNIDASLPSSSTVTFILTGKRLVTVRYHDLKAFPLFLSRVEKKDIGCGSAAAVMTGLVEALIHRAADLVERMQDEVEKTVQQVFEIKGGQQEAQKFIDHLKVFSLLANVADVKSLVIHPASTTHSQMSKEELLGSGITPSTIRLSIGTEHIDDILYDLEQAFQALD